VDSARGLFIPQNISDSATTSLEDLNKINPDICLMPVSPDGGNTFISRANIFTQGLWRWEFQYTAPLTKIMPYTWKYVIRRIGTDAPDKPIIAEIQYNSNEKEGPSVNQLLAHHISLGDSGTFARDADPTTKQVILPKGRLDEPGIDTVLRDEIRAGKSLLFDMKRGGDWDVCFANSYIRSSGETYRNTGLMTGDPTAALLNIAMDNATIIDAADYLIIYRSQYTSVALSESQKILLNITKVVRSIATDLMVLALICPDPDSPGSPAFLQGIAADIFKKINDKADGNFFWNIKLRDIRIYLDKILGLTAISNCEFVTKEMRSVMKECKEKILFLKGKIKDEANTKVRMSIRKMMRAVQNDCVKDFINLLIPAKAEMVTNVDFLQTQLDRYNVYYTGIRGIIDSLRKDIPHYILHGLMQMYFDSNDFSIDRNLDCLKFNHVNLENITTLWDSIRSSYSEILAIPDTTVSDRSFSFPTYGALVNKIVQYNIELKTFAESLIQQDPDFYMKHRIIIGDVVERVAAVEEVAEIEDVAEDNEIVKDEVASFIEDPTVVAPDQRLVLKNFISNFRELSGTGMYDDNKDITKRIKLNRTQKDTLKNQAFSQLREIVRAIRLPAALSPAAPMNLSGGGLRGDGLRGDGLMDEDIYNLILSYLSNISQQVNASLSYNPRLLKAYYRAIVNTSSPDELVKFQEDIIRSGNTIEGFIEYIRVPTEEKAVTFTEAQIEFPKEAISDIIIYSRNILDELFLDKINYYTALNDTFSLFIVNGIHAYLKEYITNETVFEKYFENLKVRGALEENRRYAELQFQYYRIMALALLFEAINAENKISFFSILFAGGKPNLKPYINVNTEFIKRFLDAAWHVFGAEVPYAAYKKSIGPLMMGTGRALGGGRAKTYRRKKSPTHYVHHANTVRASASGRAPRGRRVSRKKQTRRLHRRHTRRNKY